MKVDFHTGEESWLAEAYGEPQFTYFGGLDYEIVVHTTRGVVTMMVTAGDPCSEIDPGELRAALKKLRLERTS